MGVENDPLKAAAIPRFDKGAESIHSALERRGEFAVPIDGFTGELALQHRRGEARRLEGNRDSGRKNRIEKLAGVAEQSVAGAAQGFHIGRIADDPTRGRVPARSRQQAV